ncbi:MAG TPA: response regulator transcription factor [Verrucomicrobiae bacterium]|jgi:DNA-binding NarL/FixJ family response regulator
MNGYNEIEIEIENEIRDAGVRSTIPAHGRSGQEARPIRIWLVDDNSALRDLLANLLNGEPGLECERQFASPATVLEALAAELAPDVILLDIQMGAENGLDAIRPIKLLAKNTHVLMLTTFAQPEARERAFRDGASDFLSKAWAFDEIARHIRQAMEFGSVAGLLTTFLDRDISAGSPEKSVRTVMARKSSGTDRWFANLRGWLKFSPS